MGIPGLGIIKAVAGLGQTWLEGRNTKIKAQAEAEATVITIAAQSSADWERIMAQNSGNSWKDEWLTLLFSIPMILCFFPGTVQYVVAGFDALEAMPEWYQYTLSVIVAASFGVRSAIGFMGKRKANES
jgi:hypothetical protein